MDYCQIDAASRFHDMLIDNHSHLYSHSPNVLDRQPFDRNQLFMYVCVCHAISDRQIREAVDRGAESLHEVQAYLPVGNCCGACTDSAEELIESHVESTARSAAA
jgi:bacterioferritin-associated ferredoxin